MKSLLSYRPSKTISIVLLGVGAIALLIAIFSFERNELDSSFEANIFMTQWPMLFIGLAAGGLGTAGLVALRSKGLAQPQPDRRPPVELEVRVETNLAGYVTTLVPPIGESARHIVQRQLPVDRGLSELQEELRLPHRRRIGTKRNRALERFGSTLFNTLFEGPLEPVYRASLDHAISMGVRLNIVLQLHSSVADIPWEYMFDETKGSYLSLSYDTSLTRRLRTIHSTSPLPAITSLRILTMGASPDRYEPLDIEVEQQLIETELQEHITNGRIEFRSVSGSSFSDLRAALDDFEPHVLHFSGHGQWDEDLDDGVILFASEAGVAQQATGRDLGVLLNRKHLRLAVFNSCDAGRASKTDRFAGITVSLVAQGVPAAVGMQFRFDDAAATTFGCALLTRLVESHSVADALLAGRMAVFTMPNDVEWGTPVLTARVALDEILNQPATGHDAQR